MLSDWISALLGDQQLWPYEYLHHLSRVIGTIAAHGHAVIVGRGASFILPPEISLRLLVVSPLDERIKNVAKTFECFGRRSQKAGHKDRIRKKGLHPPLLQCRYDGSCILRSYRQHAVFHD